MCALLTLPFSYSLVCSSYAPFWRLQVRSDYPDLQLLSFYVPLLGVWCVTIFCFFTVRKHIRQRWAPPIIAPRRLPNIGRGLRLTTGCA